MHRGRHVTQLGGSTGFKKRSSHYPRLVSVFELIVSTCDSELCHLRWVYLRKFGTLAEYSSIIDIFPSGE